MGSHDTEYTEITHLCGVVRVSYILWGILFVAQISAGRPVGDGLLGLCGRNEGVDDEHGPEIQASTLRLLRGPPIHLVNALKHKRHNGN